MIRQTQNGTTSGVKPNKYYPKCKRLDLKAAAVRLFKSKECQFTLNVGQNIYICKEPRPCWSFYDYKDVTYPLNFRLLCAYSDPAAIGLI